MKTTKNQKRNRPDSPKIKNNIKNKAIDILISSFLNWIQLPFSRQPKAERSFFKIYGLFLFFTIIRNSWDFLFLKPLLSKALEKLFQLLKRYHFKIRIRPPTKRDKKHMRANERHMTDKNYKPAF